MTNPKAWRALIARAIDANNEEVAAGTDMSPNEYMERFVQDGKQAVAIKAIDGDDVERTAKAEKELDVGAFHFTSRRMEGSETRGGSDVAVCAE